MMNLEDTRPPPALKFPADPGWRIVWMRERPAVEGVSPLRAAYDIVVEPITHWAIEAPSVLPGQPGEAPAAQHSFQVRVTPLCGPSGERFPIDAHVFRIASPRDARGDAELLNECEGHLLAADARLKR